MDETDGCKNWVYPNSLRALPLDEGHIYPKGTPHAVSSSLPTWESVIALSLQDKASFERIDYSYPRFFIGKPIRSLILRVKERLNVNSNDLACYIFPSPSDANAYAATLRRTENAEVHHIRFSSPGPVNSENGDDYLSFSVLLLPSDLKKYALSFWMNLGTGITTRHAEYCLEHFDELISESLVDEFETVATAMPSCDPASKAWIQRGPKDLQDLKAHIAHLATSEKPDLKCVEAGDVFIFPNGMNAIFIASEAIAAINPESTVVAYGWIYPETINILREGSWADFIDFKLGSEEDLDQLAAMLMTNDEQITALFCELPSNIKFTSPNLHRIRELADEYDLIVVCDETVGNFVNIDLLPYVDIITTSLTKMFNGAANVTGGSVIINPNSRHYSRIYCSLSERYQVVSCFPKDIAVLKQNSINMAERVKKANANTLIVVDLFEKHPSVAYVNYPSRGSTFQNYERHRRQNGGYGNVLSVVFRNPASARQFYDKLDVCKGTSFGTNFTLAIPFVQLAVYQVQEKLEQYGLPRHILRINVGLEDPDEICAKMSEALVAVEEFEQIPRSVTLGAQG